MSPPDQVPEDRRVSVSSHVTTVTVVPAGAGPLALHQVARGAAQLHHRPNVVAAPGDVAVHVAVVDREAGTLEVGDQEQELVGVTSLAGAAVLPAVLQPHLLQLQPVHPVTVRL